MNNYLIIVSRSILTLGYGNRILIPIEVECKDNDEVIRHAKTLEKRGDKIFAIYHTVYNIWESEDE